MILVILAIGIGLIILGLIIYANYRTDWDFICLATGSIITIIALLFTILLSVDVSSINVLDEKITMYQEENVVIESQIATIVNEYKSYETDTFENVKPDDAMTYVTLYPELKSDILVQKQIEVYVSNNNKIKELKEKQISGDVYRWWLYFGG